MRWRWPWVSRARLEAAQIVADERLDMLSACRARVVAADAALAAERERYAALVVQMVELKKLDYGPTPVIPMPPKTPVKPIPLSVMKNIAQLSEPNSRERRRMEGRVRDLLESGVPEDTVAQMVLDGEPMPADVE